MEIARDLGNSEAMKPFVKREILPGPLTRMFKPVKEVADRSGEVWIAAEIKINSAPPACDP